MNSSLVYLICIDLLLFIILVYTFLYQKDSKKVGKSIVITKLEVSSEVIKSSGSDKKETIGENHETNFAAPIIADQYYYLPTASLIIKATAKVVVILAAENNQIISAKLTGLQFENNVVLEPDTSQLFSLTYKPFSFANDELHLITNASGLLENISATTEDRISNIISEISSAPKVMLVADEVTDINVPDISKQKIITQTILYTNTFTILAEEFRNQTITRSWIINVDGIGVGEKTVNASLVCTINPKSINYCEIKKPINGILTRPLYTSKLDVTMSDSAYNAQCAMRCEIRLPDPSVLILVPIERASFVKKISTPKFSNGLLIENFISKPSEVEGFLSIPINILKAIVSIPAQLLSFKISHIQQQTALEAAKQSLAKAQLLSKNDPAIKDAELAKSKLQTEKAALNSQKDLLNVQKDLAATQANWNSAKNDIQDLLQKVNKTKTDINNQGEQIPKLGKLPAPSPDLTIKKLQKYVNIQEFSNTVSAQSLQNPPPEYYWQNAFTGTWNSYQNYEIRDCVPAAAAHMITCWSSNALPNVKLPAEDDVIKMYSSISSYDPSSGDNDNGCKIWKVLAKWKNDGISNDKIDAYIPIAARNIDELKLCVYLFGGCLAGLKMPISAQKQEVWDVPAGGAIGDGLPDSWDGHAVPVVGYNKNHLFCISWNKVIPMTWTFYNTYNDESYAVLSHSNWINPSGYNPLGIDYATLSNDLNNLGIS